MGWRPMNEQDAIALAEEVGWELGRKAGSYSPPISWGICPEADDAFIVSYFSALAYSELA